MREQVDIVCSGPQDLHQVTTSGRAVFNGVAVGTYGVKVTAPPDLFHETERSASSSAVTPGGTGEARVDFKWLLNVVTPKLEVEYKVVLLDRGLAAHQAGSEAVKIHADDVTVVEVSARETTGAPPYTGGGTLEAPNCEVFSDAACTTPAGKIAKDKLFAGPVKLYLKAKTAGKFTAKLTLDPAANPRVRVEGPATEEMGVVELKMTLHQHDIPALQAIKIDPDTEPPSKYHDDLKAKALPEQKAMSDAEKIGTGRFLHAQDGGHFGRAKLIVEKLDAGQWPAGTDDYEIALADAGGRLALHGKEEGDDAKALPVKSKVSALKTAAQTLWVEGKAASAALRDATLSLGLDRAAGGLAHTPKGNGDCARFTVVKIDKLEIDYKAAGGEHPAWDEAEKRFYININRKGDPAGRKVKFKATVAPAVAGVPLRFMLAPDKDNQKTANWGIDFPADGKNGGNPVSSGADVKWKDVPAAIKHLDKADRKDLLHLAQATGGDGTATCELTLSRCGGDKFHPAAYLEQDPHLAKYVHGHADLAKRAPKFAAVTPVQVWRKTFYQVTRPKDTAMPAAGGFDGSQRKVFLEPKATSEKQMQASDFTIDPYRPDWQFNPGGADTKKLCIGTHNVDDALKLFVAETADTAPKFNVILCDEQFDAKGVKTDSLTYTLDAGDAAGCAIGLTSSAVEDRYLTICNPPLQGGALVMSATWKQQTLAGGAWTSGAAQNFPAANVQVQKTRGSKNEVWLVPPGTAMLDATHQIEVTLQLQAADGGYNGWAPNNSVANVVKGGRADYAIHNTMAHELGHLFGKVRSVSQAGLPDHPLYYQRRGGSGTHCAFNATWHPNGAAPALDPTKAGERDAQGNGAGQYDDGDCIIFGYSVDKKREWCRHCALDFILFDLSKFG